ncbi:MAG: HAD-IB family phosphatase [Patescibacteria group bacterium]
MPKRWFIIDFDSTFLKSESLAEFAKKALYNNEKRDEIIAKIDKITKQGQEGSIPFSTSLRSRLKLFAATKAHLEELISELKTQVSDSIVRNREFFKTHAASIYIVSSGFQEIIIPIVHEFGISESHVRANSLRFNSKGTIIGVDETNPLSHDRGKVTVVEGTPNLIQLF